MASIASEQIRAARSLLRISVNDLADRSGIGVATIKRIEAMSGVPAANARSVDSIARALVTMGIEFIGDAHNDPGVRLKTKKP